MILKWISRKKKLKSGIIPTLLICFCLTSCSSSKSSSPSSSTPNYDGLYFDFSNCKSLAIVDANNTSKSFRSSSSTIFNTLYKITETGEYEPIKVYKTVTDGNYEEEQEIILQVADVKVLGNFTFISYSESGISNGFNWRGQQSYVIDNTTGKSYSLESICGENGSKMIGLSYLYGDKGNYSDNAVFIGVTEMNFRTYSIYKLYINNENLILEEMVSTEQISFSLVNYFIDQYNNLYITEGDAFSTVSSTSQWYILKNNKTISILDSAPSLSYDKFAYIDDQIFNESGDLSTPPHAILKDYMSTAFQNSLLSKDDETATYYYGGKLIKITNNSDVYTATEFDIGTFSQYALAGSYFYGLNSSVIKKISLTDGTTVSEITDYIFNNIYTYGDGIIYFDGINSSLDTVKGIIDKDGNVTTTYEEYDFDIITVIPM